MSESATPPQPDGIPLLGQALAFGRDPFGSLERWATLGDVVQLEFPGSTFYLVSDPKLVQTVLHDGDGRFTISRAQRESFADVEDHAVSTAEGDSWRRLRRALHPAFTRDAIEGYERAMVRETAERVEEWDDGETIDLHHEMRTLTLSVLGATLLGADITGDESTVIEATDALAARADPRRPGQLLPGWVPTPTDRRLDRALTHLESVVDAYLEADHGGGADVRSVLLEAQDRGELTREEVRHNLVALLLAGSDTTSLGLTYCWHLLSSHPDVLDELVDATADDRTTPELLEAVVAETLRLYPPSWNTMRRTTRAVELGDYTLPSGAELMCPQWVLHRDGRFWDDPAVFRPRRWVEERDRPEYAYFPFSGGPRHCVGMHFARQELALALETMVCRVTLEVETTEPLAVAPTISLRPETSIRATVSRRT